MPSQTKSQLNAPGLLAQLPTATAILTARRGNPGDPNVACETLFAPPIQPDGHISLTNSLSKETWHRVRFEWDLDPGVCTVSVDGTTTLCLKPSYRQALGITTFTFARLRRPPTRQDSSSSPSAPPWNLTRILRDTLTLSGGAVPEVLFLFRRVLEPDRAAPFACQDDIQIAVAIEVRHHEV